MRKISKNVTAVAMSAAMVMSMGMPVFAGELEDIPEEPTTTNSADIEAPIYSFEVLDIVVPATYAVAFNPDELAVETEDATLTAQILSNNYGIVNKGNKDQIITVSLTVADQNTGDAVAVFVDSADEVTNAAEGEYKIHLMAVPADTAEVKLGTYSADEDTAAADLDNVAMTKADGKGVTLKAGENKIGFKLEKATYAPISGSEVTLGTSANNNVAVNYELTGLAAAGKGITAFTFDGSMNANANWSKLTQGIKITAVYSNEIAPSDAAVVAGTGAMVTLDTAPGIVTTEYTATSGVALPVTVSLGSGEKAATSIASVTNAVTNAAIPAARYSVSGTTLTFDATFITNNMVAIRSTEGLKIKVTFDDAAKTEVTITITE